MKTIALRPVVTDCPDVILPSGRTYESGPSEPGTACMCRNSNGMRTLWVGCPVHDPDSKFGILEWEAP